MRQTTRKGWAVLATLVLVSATAACSDGPTEPAADINPGLLSADDVMGLASGAAPSLPQGSAAFEGPGGMDMDAAGEEFIQQLVLPDGTVMKTSGVYVKAVPDESVIGAPFERLSFGSAVTGSHVSVGPGTYTITGDWPDIDFIEVIPVTYGQIIEERGEPVIRAEGGEITIQSLDYFQDVYTCEFPSSPSNSLVIDRCEDQFGVMQGVVDLTATLGSGETVVLEAAPFTVPIRRRTIFAHRDP